MIIAFLKLFFEEQHKFCNKLGSIFCSQKCPFSGLSKKDAQQQQIIKQILELKDIDLKQTMQCIDIRSDTVTHPYADMLKAMLNAEIGDDWFGDDQETILLEKETAELLGKEAALFVPSGTFANQLALYTHQKQANNFAIMGKKCHIYDSEFGCNVAKLLPLFIKNDDGFYDMQVLESVIKENVKNIDVLCLENPSTTGRVQPISYMKNIYELAQKYQIKVHVDSARIFSVGYKLKIDVKEMTQYCDSLMFCLSKNLCAPIGSMLVGNKQFITEAREKRRLMGGTMRQVGYLAAAGRIALKQSVLHLGKDLEIAEFLLQNLKQMKQIEVLQEKCDIPMFFFKINIPNLDENKLYTHMQENNIKIEKSDKGVFRIVTHYYIREKEAEQILNAYRNFLEQY